MSEENADLLKRAVDRGELVVAIGHIRTRGKASGAETRSPDANLAEIRNGSGIRIRGYLDLAEAIDAAGVGSRPEPRSSG